MQMTKESDRNVLVDGKFYYPVRGGACLSKCLNLKDGTRIGSVTCRDCINCVDSNTVEGYVICNEIETAVGEGSVALKTRNYNYSK